MLWLWPLSSWSPIPCLNQLSYLPTLWKPKWASLISSLTIDAISGCPVIRDAPETDGLVLIPPTSNWIRNFRSFASLAPGVTWLGLRPVNGFRKPTGRRCQTHFVLKWRSTASGHLSSVILNPFGKTIHGTFLSGSKNAPSQARHIGCTFWFAYALLGSAASVGVSVDTIFTIYMYIYIVSADTQRLVIYSNYIVQIVCVSAATIYSYV